jgi:DNA-binding Lrp family transcriptional regulator
MLMLSFFPNPYPDELLYSVLARYNVRSGNISPKITLRELFGNEKATAIVDLPCNLEVLIKMLSNFSNYTYLDFVYNNTLFPIYAPFIPEERTKLILKTMKNSNGSSINTRIGIMANTVHNPTYLRFCPLCFEDDIKRFGEAYWHRIHQIPGVILCPKDSSFILNSLVHWHEMNKHEYVAADKCNCNIYPYKFGFNAEETNKLLKLSEGVNWVLNSKVDSNGMNWFYEKYIDILINKDYATPKGRVHQDDFIKDFCKYYDDNILKISQSEIDIDGDENWLSSIVRKPRKAFHPIRHILLINFLQLSVKEFFSEKHDYKPFGWGPWPCLNKASNHYHQNVINDISITYDNKVKQPVGTFTCNCGFVYSRRGPDQSEGDLYKIGRIKEFGLVWEGKLKELSGDGSLSFREIARQLNVDTNTVIKYIKAETNIIKEFKNNEADKQLEINRKKYREKLVKLKNENAEMTRTQLRHLDDAAYEWLHRKDKQWLNENLPTCKPRVIINERVNWEQRDFELLNKAKQIVKELLSTGEKPERITISRIGKLICAQTLLEKHIDKLPKTNKYLKSVIEDVEAFQIRRIKWVAIEMLNSGEQLKVWAIKRKSGIRTNCSLKVNRAIEDEIDFYMENKKVR